MSLVNQWFNITFTCLVLLIFALILTEFQWTSDYGAVGVHHVGVLCENLERSLHFYLNILGKSILCRLICMLNIHRRYKFKGWISGLKINEARPHDKLPYRGAWLWVGAEMIHLMELPNPDPLFGRPEHGGRDRHTCIGIKDVSKLKVILDKAGKNLPLTKLNSLLLFTLQDIMVELHLLFLASTKKMVFLFCGFLFFACDMYVYSFIFSEWKFGSKIRESIYIYIYMSMVSYFTAGSCRYSLYA